MRFTAAALVAAACAFRGAAGGPTTSFVDPTIGTRGGLGFGMWGNPQRSPAAMAPLPLMRLGPDTTRIDPSAGEVFSVLNRHAGYFGGSDNAVRAFSHTRVQGAGEADLGTLGIMPTRKDAASLAAAIAVRPAFVPGVRTWLGGRSPFWSGWDEATEAASPGFYSVWLTDAATRADLAVSGPKAGAHSYSCAVSSPTGPSPSPASNATSPPCAVAFDACHTNHDQPCPWSSIAIAQGSSVFPGLDVYTLTASIKSTGEFSAAGVMFYVHAVVTASSASAPVPAASFTTWENHTLGLAGPPTAPANASSTSGSVGLLVAFPAPADAFTPTVITIRVGISTVDAAHALSNLLAEQTVPNATSPASPPVWLTFDQVRAQSDSQWEALLSAVQVTPAPLDGPAEADVLNRHARSLGAVAVDDTDGDGEEYGGDGEKPDENLDEETAWAAGAAADAMAAYLSTPAGKAIALQFGWWGLGAEEGTASGAAGQAAGRSLADAVRRFTEASSSSPSTISAPLLNEARLQLEEAAEAAASAVSPADVLRLFRRARIAKAKTMKKAAAAAAAKAGSSVVSGDLTAFYTMLYVVYCAPTTYSDHADGSYIGFDGATHAVGWAGGSWLSDLSLWDTHRSQAPWFGLAYPKGLRDTAASLVTMAEQGGHLPRWPFANLYTGCMVGSHGVQALGECIFSGACGWEGDSASSLSALWETTFAAITSQDGAGGAGSYASLGYAAFPDIGLGSVTLEYAYDDFAAAALATAAGDAANASIFAARSSFFSNSWCAANQTICPRFSNGSFYDGVDIYDSHPFNTHYTEGDAGQWAFSVPHNVSGLIGLYSPAAGLATPAEAFAEVLQVMHANQSLWDGLVSTTLPNPYTWLGNEPSMLMPFQHAWAGPTHVWQSQLWPRWHLRKYYTSPLDRDSIPGNDDYGTLSAWAVWTMLGLYPVTAASLFVLSGPVWASATVTVPASLLSVGAPAPAVLGSPTLSIVAHNASSSNIFVSCASANGVQLTGGPFVTYRQLWPATGGAAHGAGAVTALLEFQMVPEPSPTWCGGAA